MSSWLQGIVGTSVAALVIAIVAGFFRALATLRANTDAIRSLESTLGELKSEGHRAEQSQNARIADIETWRTAVTASLFRIAGTASHE